MGGRRVDRAHPRYRQYRLACFTRDSAAGKGPTNADEIPCAADPCSRQLPECGDRGGDPTQAATCPDVGVANVLPTGDHAYRCRMCRRPLFCSSGRLSHLTYQPKVPVSGVAISDCWRELFIEPVEWMRQDAGSATSGKLACPKCSAKVGSFTWVGERCSCGQFVCPAFHIRAQAVDAPTVVSAEVKPS